MSAQRRSPPRDRDEVVDGGTGGRARDQSRPFAPGERDAVGDRPGEKAAEQHEIGRRAVGREMGDRPQLHAGEHGMFEHRLSRPAGV